MSEKRQKPDWKSGILFFFLGLTVCFFALRMGVGKPSAPGPGFLPFVAGLFLAFLSLLLLFAVHLGKAGGKWEARITLRNVISILGGMAAYAYLLNHIGFVFVTFGFVTLLIRFIEPQSWTKAIIGGAAASGISFLLFDILLKTPLPRTFLGFF